MVRTIITNLLEFGIQSGIQGLRLHKNSRIAVSQERYVDAPTFYAVLTFDFPWISGLPTNFPQNRVYERDDGLVFVLEKIIRVLDDFRLNSADYFVQSLTH